MFTRLGGTAAMAAWARRNQAEFYRLYARLITDESTTATTVRDAEDVSTDELLAIAGAGHSRSEEAESDVEPDDKLH